MSVTLDRAWLLANGVSPDTLERALAAAPKPSGTRAPIVSLQGIARIIEATSGEGWWEASWQDWHPVSKNMHKRGIRAWCRARSIDDVALNLWSREPNGPPEARRKRRVSLAIVRRRTAGRLSDPQNHEESLYDCLVKAGLLVDDDTKWLERGPTTVAADKQLSAAWVTRIRLEDVG